MHGPACKGGLRKKSAVSWELEWVRSTAMMCRHHWGASNCPFAWHEMWNENVIFAPCTSNHKTLSCSQLQWSTVTSLSSHDFFIHHIYLAVNCYWKIRTNDWGISKVSGRYHDTWNADDSNLESRKQSLCNWHPCFLHKAADLIHICFCELSTFPQDPWSMSTL